ncbi:hypothetical protein D9758_015602 [Neofusicoccum parvum]|uniref:Uncharacterized protein n=1 Tax=Neofusicoccum parvum TaxID=310453 RepID=A0ACB5SCP0_9PEZI|nr:hypothetical protein D9758_015602 [Neofusicoccum parvum]
MNDVYQNATVTLFATNSSTSDEGFLKQRELVPGCSLTFGSHGCRISLRIHHDWLINHITDDNFGIRTHKAPWRTRGWTLQEYLSASRGLLFTAHQMSWNCPARIQRENGQRIDKATDRWRGTANHLDARRNTSSDSFAQVADGWTALTRLAPPEDARAHRQLLVALFYRVTNDYAERSFTFQSDKLAATAGLAKLLEARLAAAAVRYWAGVWDADWARGLAWRGDRADLHADFDRLLRGRAAGFASAAPSWSWASVIDSYYDSWADHGGLVAQPRALVVDVRPPEVRDADDRFIPRGPLVLRLTAPLRRLSGRWFETGCEGVGGGGDLAWAAFEKYLRKQLFIEQKNLRVPEDELWWRHRISEFGQKHRAWPGQQFAVIQLLEWEIKQEAWVETEIELE